MIEQTLKLGKLESVHGVAGNYLLRVFIISVVCLLIFAWAIYAAYAKYRLNPVSYSLTEDAFRLFFFGVVPLSVFLSTLWTAFRKGRVELRIYEYGFVHRIGSRTEICEWTEIKNIFIKIVGSKYLLQIEKINGEQIFLTEATDGIQQIAERIDGEMTSLGDE